MSTLLVNEVKSQAFAQVLGAAPEVVERAILQHETVGETSLEQVTAKLAGLLGVSKGDALAVLGISRSRKSRNPTMNVALLDRAYSALELYARVASLLGSQRAQDWFRTPKAALEENRPVELLETRVGLAKLSSLVTALEDGAFV